MWRSGIFGAALAGALLLTACEDASVTRVDDVEHLVVKGHKITLHGVKAPNPKGECEMEQQAGQRALDRLQALIKGAKDVSFRKTGMACLQFMSCDGFVMADGVDVGELLIAEGLVDRQAREVAGRDWCALKPLPPAEAIVPAPVVPPGSPN